MFIRTYSIIVNNKKKDTLWIYLYIIRITQLTIFL